MFNFLKRQINLSVVDYSFDHIGKKSLRPNYSYKFLPKWFKNSKNFYTAVFNDVSLDISTARACPAIKNNILRGLIIPLWTDLNIKIYPDKTFRYISRVNSDQLVKGHDPSSLVGLYDPEKWLHLKINSPWGIKSDTPCQFMFTEVISDFSYLDKMKVIPGIVDYSSDTHSTHIQLLFKIEKEPYQINLKACDPIVQIIPLSEKKLKINYIEDKNHEMVLKYHHDIKHAFHSNHKIK